jgi:hypothetical protein
MTDWDWDFPRKGYLLKNNNQYFKTIRWIWKDPIKMQYSLYQIVIFTDKIADIVVFREINSPQHYIDKFPECKDAKIVDFKKEIRKQKINKINDSKV